MLSEAQRAECERLLPYVDVIARRFSRRDDEYCSEARLALCRAVQAFDPSRGVPVEKFVGVCVQNRLKRLARRRPHESIEDVPAGPGGLGLHDVVKMLPESLRAVAEQRWVDGDFLYQIAERHGLSRGEVHSRLREARAAARAMLDDQVSP